MSTPSSNPLSDIVADVDLDGVVCAAIALRSSPTAQIHFATRSSLPAVMRRVEPKVTGGVLIADLAVNRATVISVVEILESLNRDHTVEWYDTHEFEGSKSPSARADPRYAYCRLVLDPNRVAARLVQSARGSDETERLAQAAEMADMHRDPSSDPDLWNQVYLARAAISGSRADSAWLVEMARCLSVEPSRDLRSLPDLKRRATDADRRLEEAVEASWRTPTLTLNNGLVAIWVEPDVPEAARSRPGNLAGKLAWNRTAIVIVPDPISPEWVDIRARIPFFWKEVDLRVLTPVVTELGGFGSGSRGATHWNLPSTAVAEFVQAVRAASASLYGRPRGRPGRVPPKGRPKL